MDLEDDLMFINSDSDVCDAVHEEVRPKYEV